MQEKRKNYRQKTGNYKRQRLEGDNRTEAGINSKARQQASDRGGSMKRQGETTDKGHRETERDSKQAVGGSRQQREGRR